MRTHTLALSAITVALGLTVAFGSTPPRAAADGRAGGAPGFSAVSTSFLPSRDGFGFRNRGPRPGDNALVRAMSGRCGGMSFSAIDAFQAGTALPEGASLEKRLLERSGDSISANLTRFALWTVWPDRSTRLARGVGELTRDEELPRLARGLESGPVPLGLVRARSLSKIGLNHQVVAYGIERRANTAIIHVYDPGQPGADSVTLELDLTDPSGRIDEYNGDWLVATWRGAFVEQYVPPANR